MEPVRYDPSVERPAPDEASTVEQLKESFRRILETTSRDYGHAVRAVRAVHAKAHGIARGTLTVADDLPPELAQGLFAMPGAHEAILRFSTNPGDILDDGISVPRGLALKVLEVTGARLPGSEGDSTQDFVMVNGPAFAARDPKAFLGNLKLLARTTDKAEGLKKALSATLQAVEGALETVGVKSALVQQLGGAAPLHPLGQTYYTQTAFRHGDFIAKYSLAPLSRALTELAEAKVHAHGRPDALREDIAEVIAEQGGTWELRVQLCTDLAAMPVEDPSVPWDEQASPFRPVATLSVPPQASWRHGASDRMDTALAFSPWHGLDAHRPLGGINRVRKPTYEFSAGFRAEFNRCPIHEPRALADVPG